jgi:hypothetical protein
MMGLGIEDDVVGSIVERGEAHPRVDGECTPRQPREEKGSGLHYAGTKVGRAIDLSADYEHNLLRTIRHDPGSNDIDRADQSVC